MTVQNEANQTNETIDLPSISAERTEPGFFVARNDRGGEVRIGLPGASNSFTPGELLQLAVAGCQGLASEAAVTSRLGEGYSATVSNDAVYLPSEERVTTMTTQYDIDMSSLNDLEREALVAHVTRVIDQICIVGRTVEQGAQVDLEINHLEK